MKIRPGVCSSCGRFAQVICPNDDPRDCRRLCEDCFPVLHSAGKHHPWHPHCSEERDKFERFLDE